MFELKKKFYFEAGHVLSKHDGQCSRPHGHSYILELHLTSPTLIETGPKKNMVHDFADIKETVTPIINTYLDHQWLNNTLETDSPTVEFIAKWIYDAIKGSLPQLSAITLHETSSSCVTYRPKPSADAS